MVYSRHYSAFFDSYGGLPYVPSFAVIERHSPPFAVIEGQTAFWRLYICAVKGMSTKDEANASRIKKARIIFSPGAVLRGMRQNGSFEALDVLS
ncbi:MAG: hypothetical protein LBU37_07405 [Tannerellaceae bacterium]|jgi:hypothetical protein|nr:hypothetical protein [Tannerellaceae bacterium]